MFFSKNILEIILHKKHILILFIKMDKNFSPIFISLKIITINVIVYILYHIIYNEYVTVYYDHISSCR